MKFTTYYVVSFQAHMCSLTYNILENQGMNGFMFEEPHLTMLIYWQVQCARDNLSIKLDLNKGRHTHQLDFASHFYTSHSYVRRHEY